MLQYNEMCEFYKDLFNFEIIETEYIKTNLTNDVLKDFLFNNCYLCAFTYLGNLYISQVAVTEFDEYMKPKKWKPILKNNNFLSSKILSKKNSVIYDPFNYSIRNIIHKFYKKILDNEKVIEQHLKMMMKPLIIECDKAQVSNLKRVLNAQQNGDFAILTSTKMKLGENYDILNLEFPFIIDKLELLKDEVLNDFYDFVGLENRTLEKKERVNIGETLVSNGLANYNKKRRLKKYEEFFTEIYNYFGVSILIEVNTDLENTLRGEENDIV